MHQQKLYVEQKKILGQGSVIGNKGQRKYKYNLVLMKFVLFHHILRYAKGQRPVPSRGKKKRKEEKRREKGKKKRKRLPFGKEDAESE